MAPLDGRVEEIVRVRVVERERDIGCFGDEVNGEEDYGEFRDEGGCAEQGGGGEVFVEREMEQVQVVHHGVQSNGNKIEGVRNAAILSDISIL